MSNSINLPFQFNVDSLDSWLTKLEKIEHKIAASQVYNVLKQINSKNTPLESLFLTLNSLTPMVFRLAEHMNILPDNESYQQKKQKLSKLNSYLVRALARGYFELSIHPEFEHTFNKIDQSLIISQAIHCFALTQKFNALNYDFPPTSIWKNLGVLYQQAEKTGLLKSQEKNVILGNRSHNPIITHIKCNLLFSLTNPYQYSQNNISTIYSFFERHADLLDISRPNHLEGQVAPFYWDFHSDMPPQPTQPLRADNLLIKTDKIVDHMYSSTFFSGKSKLPKELGRKIQTSLSSYNNIFKDITPAPPQQVNIIHGYEEAVNFFEQENQKRQFFRATPKMSLPIQNKMLEMEPMDQQQGKTHTFSQNDFMESDNLSSAVTGSFFETQNPDFYVVVLQNIQPKLNDLAIISTGKKIFFGIFRQQQNAPVINAQQYILEIVSGSISLMQINDNSTDPKTGLIIDQNKDHPVVLLKPEKFTSTTDIKITSENINGRYYLFRLMELTPNFMRYQIISD